MPVHKIVEWRCICPKCKKHGRFPTRKEAMEMLQEHGSYCIFQ